MWVPEWVGVEQLVSSGRVLEAIVAGDDVEIDWAQIEADVTREVLQRLGEGPRKQRLDQLDELHATGPSRIGLGVFLHELLTTF